MRKVLVVFLAIVFLLGGCTKSSHQENTIKEIRFSYQDGTPALTAAKLAFDNPVLDKSINISYDLEKTPDLLLTKILKQEADIAIIPSNLAAQVVNKGLPYKIVGTATWGSLYLVSTDDIKSIQDLKGREIYSFGRGLTPDLVLKYVLSNNGIDFDKDISITYLNAASEVGVAFIGGKTNLALLAEPMLTTVKLKKPDTKVIFDLNEEWAMAAQTEKGYPQSCLIIKEDLLENNKQFVDKFVDNYADSRKWAADNPSKLADYAEKLGIGVSRETLGKGIVWTNIDYFHIKDCKEEYDRYYEIIRDFAPDSIGGKIPDEKIYFER